MSDLIFYLENNGFYPRTEDLEAILRRCDHDADRALSFEEFCEIAEIVGQVADSQKAESPEKINASPKDDKDNTNERAEAEKREKEYREELAKREKEYREELEKREKEYREELERQEKEAKEAAEKREKEWKELQQRKFEGATKLVDYLTDRIANFVNIDCQKKFLSYHGSFNSMDFFRELDKNQNGFITADEIAKYFAEDEDFNGFDFEALVKYWN